MKRFAAKGLAQHAKVYKIGDQSWVVKQKYRQSTNNLQAMKDRNEQSCDGRGDKMVLMGTLPMADAITLQAQGINAFNPNDDEMAYIMRWMRTNRPHLVGEKYRVKRSLDLPSRLIKKGVNSG